jgi:branched-chain amino acid transport system permease protein
VLYRENGQFKTSYAADQQIFPIAQDRWAIIGIVVFAFVAFPAGRRVHVPRHPDSPL